MNEKELIKWAVAGINAKINELGDDIFKGRKYLQNGKSPKTPDEIRAIIESKENEIDELKRKLTELDFEKEG